MGEIIKINMILTWLKWILVRNLLVTVFVSAEGPLQKPGMCSDTRVETRNSPVLCLSK